MNPKRRKLALATGRASSAAEAGFTAEDIGHTPLLPANLILPIGSENAWTRDDSLKAVCETARLMAASNDFVGSMNYIRHCYFSDGFRLGPKADPKLSKWQDNTAVGFNFRRISDDAWTEFLTMDSVIAMWVRHENETQGLPTVLILDTERCEYSDSGGVPTLKYRPERAKLSDAQKKILSSQWVNAYEKGTPVLLSEKRGEFFKVLTRAKRGKGLGKPRLGQIAKELETYDLIKMADFAGAFQHKDVIRHWKKGHETRYGADAGTSRNFIKDADQKQMQKSLRSKQGPFTIGTNFDWAMVYAFLDPRFFDSVKYEGTLMRLKHWGGAASQLLEKGQLSPFLMDVFETEGRKNRELMSDFLTEIFNDPNFIGPVKAPPSRLLPQYNPHSFLSTKMMLEWVRVAGPNGYASPQTVRGMMQLDDKIEGDLMVDANKAKNRPRFTPPFEQKQNMGGGSGGGRPSDKSTTSTPPPSGEQGG